VAVAIISKRELSQRKWRLARFDERFQILKSKLRLHLFCVPEKIQKKLVFCVFS